MPKVGDRKLLKVCCCGYERITSKESWTKCPECGDKNNWEFVPVVWSKIGMWIRR